MRSEDSIPAIDWNQGCSRYKLRSAPQMWLPKLHPCLWPAVSQKEERRLNSRDHFTKDVKNSKLSLTWSRCQIDAVSGTVNDSERQALARGTIPKTTSWLQTWRLHHNQSNMIMATHPAPERCVSTRTALGFLPVRLIRNVVYCMSKYLKS